MEWFGGIASSAATIGAAARRGNADALVAGTRKNVPGNRRLAVKAFRAGGAVMHRSGCLRGPIAAASRSQCAREGASSAR